MSTQMKGLGRGLDALLNSERSLRAAGDVQRMALNSIISNPGQPRRAFSEHALDDLAASIRNQGLLQPIIVRPVTGSVPPQYEIVAGERRWRASKKAGLIEVPVLVRELSDQDALVIALIENLQREDLNPLEEAQGLQQLKEEFALSQDELAQKLGKSRSAVANTLRLLNLAPAIRQDMAEGRLSAGHGRALLAVSDPAEQDRLRKQIIAEGLSVREAEGLVALWKESQATPVLTATAQGAEEQNAGQPPALGPAKNASGKAQPKSALLLNLQSRVAQRVMLPVKFSGKEDNGKLSISYSSREELQNILTLLGVSTDVEP